MSRKETNPEELLDGIIADIRDEHVDDRVVEEAARRVADRMSKPLSSSRLSNCADFQSLVPAYRDGTLAPGKRMLLEDHAHQCVGCRKVLFGEPVVPSAVIEIPARRMTRARWMAVAAAATVVLVTGRWAYEQFAPAPAGSRATVRMADGGVYRLQRGVLQSVSIGTELAEGELLRTAAGARAVVQLMDQSTVEIGERAEFRVLAARQDTTVDLHHGAIIVQAAKRRKGHLYVATGDSRVAVTGTVFSVNRGAKGTRVSVMEGEVVVEQNHRDRVLHAGDQFATHSSVQAVPIKEEIAWSRNSAEHIKTLESMVALKQSLQDVRMPGIRYQSRLMDAVPANAVIFLSIPNARESIADAQRIFTLEMRRNGVKDSEHIREFMDRISRFSEYLGEELVVAGVRSGSQITGIAIADVHRPGLAQFLEAERQRLGESKVQIVEGNQAIHSRQKEELLVSIRDNRVVFGVDDALVNAAYAGAGGFSSTPFGQRIAQAFQDGTGILFGADLQSLIRSHIEQPKDQQIVNRLGGDSLRYLIAEQNSFHGQAQHSVVLNFDGERRGLASWLGAPGPMGGLGFVSSHAQFAASVITKDPRQLIDELFAIVESRGSKGLEPLEELQRISGVDFKRDIAASLGSEATLAIDGPLIPVPSWKLILEVNQPEQLQSAIQKMVVALNSEMSKHGNGVVLEQADIVNREQRGLSGVVTTTNKAYVIRFRGNTAVPEIHYLYTDGYLVAGATQELIRNAVLSRASGNRLDQSGVFRRLLPTDQQANFSALLYQNAQETLQFLANLAPEQQEKVRELADKIGPTLIGAYAQGDRIQVTTFGSSWDLLMQTAFSPMLHGERIAPATKKQGTPQQTAAYRKQWRR